MSLPRYPEYKDSGVEWLGEVPAHWEVRRLSSLFAQVTEEGNTDLPVLMVSIHSGVSDDEIDDEERSRKVTRSEDRSKYKRVAPGDLVYNMMRAWQGGFGTVTVTGLVSPAYVVARPTATFQTRLIEHQLRSPQAIEEMRRHSRGVTDFRLRLYWDEFKTLSVTLPPATEQTAIIAFLDRETAKIDVLVAEQEKLLTLLAEKRQATISRAVTKGLDQDVPMKDSGVEWLGEVPAHWRVGKIQSFARRESGHTPSRQHPEYWENCTIPWFSLADVWQLRTGNVKYVHETNELVSELGLANSSARLLPAGTVMLSRTASVGYSAIMGCAMATTQDFINWVCKPELMPEFLLYVLRGMRSEFDRLMMGSTHQTIYMPDVAKLMMGLPSRQEQAGIVSFIDAETARLDALTAEATRAIALLKERRTALISAAVTGKIDVRNTLPPLQEACHA